LLPFSNSKVRAKKRIGPHNISILEFIFGSLLGDSHAEKRSGGTRITFQQEGSHSAYLLWLHNYVSSLGYCSTNIPKFETRLGLYGKKRIILRFRTITYISFNWIHDCFYENNKKILPICIEEYLTPLALAI
jgi:ubiquinol-cytochrome c reductase cytochrome b subunit